MSETDHLPTKHEQIAGRQECACYKFIRLHDGNCPVHGFVRKQAADPPLRFDYSVECEHCGYLKQIAPKLSEEQAQRLLHEQGWRLIGDENRCPMCANGDNSPILPVGATDLGSMFEHTPDEGEPHLMTECESRGCVKLGASER